MGWFRPDTKAADQLHRLVSQARHNLLIAAGIDQHHDYLAARLAPFTATDLDRLRTEALRGGAALVAAAQLALPRNDGNRPLRNVALQPEDRSLTDPLLAALGGRPGDRPGMDWDDPFVTLVASILDQRRSEPRAPSPVQPRDTSSATEHKSGSHPDYGTYLAEQGVGHVQQAFYDVPVTHLSRVTADTVTTLLTRDVGKRPYAVSFDLPDNLAEVIISRLPQTEAAAAALWLHTQPPSTPTFQFSREVYVTLRAMLGAQQQGQNERFRPFIVDEVA